MGGVILLLLMMALSPNLFPDQKLLHYRRVNCIAWLPYFFWGIMIGRFSGRYRIVKLARGCFFCGLSLSLVMFMNMSFSIWLLMPFAAILFFYSCALVLERNHQYRVMSIWLGNQSAYVFMAHPIALLLMQLADLQTPIVVQTIIYLILSFAISFAYRYLHSVITRIISVSL